MVYERLYSKRNRKETGSIGKPCDFSNNGDEITRARLY